ncbi:MAG: hydroxyacid dehydrogenase [Acidobacteria bacterium]|nr:hydroxyacid dehydrogenase [Acidobacteriota bacterium]
MPSIVIPDDFPIVMGSSQPYQRWIAQTPVTYYDSLPGSEDTLIERIRDAEVVINIRSSTRFTHRVFHQCPRLRLLSLWGTGTDNVDLEAATASGVTVTNTPAVSAISIAEHALMLMLACARRAVEVHNRTVAGEWPRGQSIELHGKTLGIIGLGVIGRRFASLGQGLGMRVIAWTMHPNPSLSFELVPLNELLDASDVVSLHLRLSDQTRGFLGREQFDRMKPTAILINTARGPILDEAALVEALTARRIAAAGLDVFEIEPLPPGHPLTRLSNVVLSPHCAGVTPEALQAGLALSIQNVSSFLEGRPANVVNAIKANGTEPRASASGHAPPNG